VTAATSEGSVKPGDIVAGKYRIVRVLGEGGMGVVVEALHQTLDQRVAIKFHRRQATGNPESVARFLREAKSAAQIKSEHVVRVTDVAVLDDGDPYFVMEYLEGKDLDSVIQTDGPLALATAVDYTLQVCEALAEAHALGIVHRDLKPANLFLAKRADGSIVIKLLDFGISKMVPKGADAELSMTKTRALMGSPLYMAPEQMRSTRRVDHRADLWSLGVLMHEILTGETPFLGETLPEVCASIAADEPIPLTAKRPDAPAELEEVILRCLEKDPENRFPDVADLALALAPIAPAEAERSISRIVRILRGAGTPSTPPVSLRTTGRITANPSTPYASVFPGSPNAPNADTLCIEPSDQKRSGVAAKQRIRANAPDPSRVAETMEAIQAPPSSPDVVVREGSGGKRLFAIVGLALAVGAGTAMVFMRPHALPAAAAHVEPGPPPSPAPSPVSPPAATQEGRASAVAIPVPSDSAAPATTIEFIELPNTPPSHEAQSGPHAGARNVRNGKGPQALTKNEHADAAAIPASSSAGSAPAPSGTAAFGAARD
jgi:serine/threonine protein kinase